MISTNEWWLVGDTCVFFRINLGIGKMISWPDGPQLKKIVNFAINVKTVLTIKCTRGLPYNFI